jgi:hypothetical protein
MLSMALDQLVLTRRREIDRQICIEPTVVIVVPELVVGFYHLDPVVSVEICLAGEFCWHLWIVFDKCRCGSIITENKP